jgi:2-iminobutanoate/2-iminopropanoate deaminase
VSRRQCYEIPGVDHGSAPIPMAARVGTSFQTSAVMGKDRATNTLPEDGVRQVELVFANVKALLAAADVELDQLTYVEVLLADNSLRDEVNKYWTTWFPDPHDRPARHTTVRELPGGMVVQLRVQAHVENAS